jgi:hypothetical protein
MLADFPDPTLAQVVGCGVVQTTKKKRNNVSLLVLAKKGSKPQPADARVHRHILALPPSPRKGGGGWGGGKQPLEYNHALSLENQKNARPSRPVSE